MAKRKVKFEFSQEQIVRNVSNAAWDEGNRHAEKRGAKKIGTGTYANWNKWNASDYSAACRKANEIFAALGFPQN